LSLLSFEDEQKIGKNSSFTFQVLLIKIHQGAGKTMTNHPNPLNTALQDQLLPLSNQTQHSLTESRKKEDSSSHHVF